MALGIVLGYMGLLYFGAVIVPGSGLSGQLLAQVPGNFLDWAHAPGYGILALLLVRGLERRAWPLAYALPVAAAAALVFGLWTEVFQGSIPGRESNVDDLVIDAIGIGIAATMMLSATVRNRIVLRPCLDSFLSFWRAGSLVSLDRPTKETIQTKQTR
ncbi:MAG: VanZ family protein [Nitrospira sp.]